MTLPFLPEHEILQMFQVLKRETTTTALEQLISYIDDTWIKSTTWCPAAWCVFLRPICTNNDVEGWHNGLNRGANGKCRLPLYMLTTILRQEFRLAELQIRLVSERKLTRIQRKNYRDLLAGFSASGTTTRGVTEMQGSC